MPGRRCAVFGCNNSAVLTKKTNPEIAYHNFPKGKDVVTDTIRKEWVRRCKRADKWNPSTSQICSIHFAEENYKRDFRNEMLGLAVRKLLKKKTAVPTLHLPNNKTKLEKTAREERYLRKQKTEEAEKRKEEIGALTEQLSENTAAESPKEDDEAFEDCDKTNREYIREDFRLKYEKLLESHIKLQANMRTLRQNMNVEKKRLIKQLNYYKVKHRTRNTSSQVKGLNILKKKKKKRKIVN